MSITYKPNVLYIFGGEKASGAEIVIERLMQHNAPDVNAHLFIAPGNFANAITELDKPYRTTIEPRLKKLNRSSTNAFNFYMTAIKNYFIVPFKVARYVQEHAIDVVHANTVVPASYLLPLIIFSKLFARKRKWLWSDHDLQYYSTLDTFLSKLCVQLYHKTLAVSTAVKKKYGLNDKVQVLYNGIDLSSFKQNSFARHAFRTTANIDEHEIVFGMAASIGPRKGQLGLLHVFNTVAKKYPHIKLLLAGGFADDSPIYTEEVKALLEKSERAQYVGHVKEMVAFYNGCDVIVNNSNVAGSEPLGTTIYEGMACEKIAMASNTGGTPEIIADKHDGFLFEADNLVAMEICLVHILENYQQLSPVRQAARMKASTKFNIDVMRHNYNGILGVLLNVSREARSRGMMPNVSY